MNWRYLLIFLLLGAADTRGQSLDLRLYDAMYEDRNKSLDGTMNGFSATVYPVSLAVPLGQCIYGLVNHDLRSLEYGAQTAAALAFNTMLTYGMKYGIRRRRPYEEHPQYTPYEHDSGPSFPSGHTSYAFTTATSISLEYRRWYVVVPAYAWAAGVGYARIHMGAHYPADVLAGALVGAGSAYLSYKGNQWLKGLWKKRTAERLSLEH